MEPARKTVDDFGAWIERLDQSLSKKIRSLSLVTVVAISILVGGGAFGISLLFIPGSAPLIATRVIGGLIVFFFIAIALGRSAQQAVSAEAQRIEEEVDAETKPQEPRAGEGEQKREADRENPLDKQEAILRKIYTAGLAQASTSFGMSIFFATIGAGLLFIGVGLAIFRAPTDGQAYASIVTVVAGVVVNVVSSLFFVQSNTTRKDMATQGALLREESQEDRRLKGARDLVASMENRDLQDDTKAQIALQLMRAPCAKAAKGAKVTRNGESNEKKQGAKPESDTPQVPAPKG
ncbi:hypothetical protein A5731_12915 [Mycolicibacterium conceptionense]|uniref:TRADD-N-associated membrane domain-containing protein n=1 Tax=Mycolicibacterium conceptionense TaxID=451644 RepID=UPI0007EB0389|nr:hypothetical protein [Mycolicibacterium conceptionense]OBB06866.1 hypothetical protein A5718_18660 [Mycolicibacterium conceptionense]OBF03391.1 hypothetical protein A5731_12915 [Mycolicibacterium conceptionense]